MPQAAPSHSARLAGHKAPPSPPHPRSIPPPAAATAAAAVRGGCTKNKKAFGVFTAEVSRLPPGSLCRRSRRALQLTLGLYRRKPAASQRNYRRPQRSPSHLLGQTVSAALPSRKSPPPSSSRGLKSRGFTPKSGLSLEMPPSRCGSAPAPLRSPGTPRGDRTPVLSAQRRV